MGRTFFLVVPTTKTKKPLFDQVKLAAQLSELSHHAHDPQNLPFTSMTFSKDRKTFTFTADSSRWEWDVATETLKRSVRRATMARARRRRARWSRRAWRWRGRRSARGAARHGEHLRRRAAADARAAVVAAAVDGGGGRGGDFRNYSPDSSMFAFARDHNLYLVKVATKDTVQLTHDGVKNYSFGARDTLQERQQQELDTPAAAAAGRSSRTAAGTAVAAGGAA